MLFHMIYILHFCVCYLFFKWTSKILTERNTSFGRNSQKGVQIADSTDQVLPSVAAFFFVFYFFQKMIFLTIVKNISITIL